jgi:hypothetical protein
MTEVAFCLLQLLPAEIGTLSPSLAASNFVRFIGRSRYCAVLVSLPAQPPLLRSIAPGSSTARCRAFYTLRALIDHRASSQPSTELR